MPQKTTAAFIRIKQQPYCCVPACIQMVLRRQHLPLISQQRLGQALGLVKPPAPQPSAGYGTRLQLARFEPNHILRRLGIPLHWTWHLVDQIKTPKQLEKIISASLPEKNLLVCFDWPTLFKPDNQQHWGHVCVLEKIDLQHHTIRLVDPDPTAPFRRIVSSRDLFRALQIHGRKNLASIWELHK